MAPMNRPKRQRKTGASKLLITTASLAATLGGWAVLANTDTTATQASAAPASEVAAPAAAPAPDLFAQSPGAGTSMPTATPLPTEAPSTIAPVQQQQLRRVMPMARTRSSR
jgi:hypothetical protein